MKKIALVSLTILIAACSQQVPQAVYKQQELNTVSEGVLGTVLNKRDVLVNVPDTTVPQMAVIPVEDGKGNVTTIPNPQANALGSSTGNKQVPGFEYVVKLDGGKLINVTQSDDGTIDEDDKVFVFQYPDGRTRIVPQSKSFFQKIF